MMREGGGEKCEERKESGEMGVYVCPSDRSGDGR